MIASHLALYAAVPPERLLETIGCRCGRIYEVRARDYHAAARHLTAG